MQYLKVYTLANVSKTELYFENTVKSFYMDNYYF